MKSLDPKVVWIFTLQRNLVSCFVVFAIIFNIIFISTVTNPDEISWFSYLLIYLLSFILAAVVSYLWAKLTYRFYKYELVQDSYHLEKGVIRKKYISIPYERIQNVNIHRGILARFLGLSDLDIQTAGRSSSGFSSEGRLPGIDRNEAVKLRDELIKLAKNAKSGV